jgi:septal ring factor EnvC (AmiA/AmiB activator)
VAEQSSAPRPLRQEPQRDEQEELRAELARGREEILRLRDLLIGMEHELGAARGRLAMYEDRTKRIEGAKERLAEKVPGAGFVVGLLLRLLRGRG